MQRYVTWLLSSIKVDTGTKLKYSKLFNELIKIPYEFKVPMDEHRWLDGLSLRNNYELTAHKTPMAGLPCSILEVLVALARRIEDDTMGDLTKGDRAGLWFIHMINNCGLGMLENNYYDEFKCHQIVSRLCTNQYNPDGTNGGLFPIVGFQGNMTLIPLWMQAQAWLAKIE